MPAPARAVTWWTRWKRLAHRAAEIQAHVLLFVLYALVVTPIGLVRRVFVRPGTASHGWQARALSPIDTASLADARLREARRQF